MNVPITRISKNVPVLTPKILDQFIRAGRTSELAEQYFTVDPLIAKHLLAKHNTVNRLMNANHINGLYRDMKNGDWVENSGQTISFDLNGVIINGQQRLTALEKAGKTLKLAFKFGLPVVARRVADAGVRPRSMIDQFTQENKTAKWKNERPPIARLILGYFLDKYRPHTVTINHKPTLSELTKVENEFRDEIIHAIERTWQTHSNNVTICSNAAFIYFLATQSDYADRADEFLEKLGNGTNLDADDPILVVRNRLLKDGKKSEFRHQKHKDRTLGLLTKAWNHWIAGDSLTSKTRTPDSMLPFAGLTTIGNKAIPLD